MPFLNDEQEMPEMVQPQNVRSPIKKPPEPTTWQTVAAAFRQTNTVVSSASYINRGSFVGPRKDFTYDSVTPLEKTKYEPYAQMFFDADSDEEVESIKARIDKEEEDRRIIAEGGGVAIAAQLAAGILDPINFIPVGGWLVKGASAVKAAKGLTQTAKALGVYGAKTAAVAGATEALSEAVLQQTQEIRPVEESLTNIGTATVLGGILGGTIAGVSKGLRAKVAKDLTIDDTFEGNLKYQEGQELVGRSLSSAFVVPESTIEGNTIAGSAASTAAAAFKKLNPQFNLAQSDSLVARELGQQLQEGAFLFKKNAEGTEVPIAVETRVKLYDAFVGQATEDLKATFKSYKKRVSKLDPNNAEAPLDYKNFKEQVSLALINGDVSNIPEVQAAAKAYRKYLYEPILKEGQAIEVFPENIQPRNAQSYFPQVYDQAKIIADREGLKRTIMQYLPGSLTEGLVRAKAVAKEVDILKAKISKLKPDSKALANAQKKLASLEDELDNFRIIESRLEEGDYSDIADEIIGHIQGQKEGVIFGQRIPLTKGPIKFKELDFVPQEALRPWSIIDPEEVGKSYTRQVAPEIELKRVFGDIELKDQIKAINDDYNKLINKAKDPAKVRMLEASRANDIADVEALVGRLRGTYGRPADADKAIYTFLQGTRTLSYLTKLGGVTVSSLSDLHRLIQIKGMLPLVNEALIPMITNFKSFKLSAKEAKLAGAAWEVALGNTRAISMAELFNPISAGNRIRKGLDAVSDIFTRATLAPQFDSARKIFSSVLIQRKNLEDIDLLVKGQLDQAGIADLARNGIGIEQARGIDKMFKEFGKIDGELYIANTDKWTDKDAVFYYRAALNKQISFYATMPGIGDKPRWMSTELGKTIAQFESFNLAATSKITVANLQTADMKTLNSIVVSVMLGMGVYAYRQWSNNKELSDNPADWIAAGVDNSGLTGILSSANERISTLTNNSVTASRLIGASNDRYRRSAAEKFDKTLGPSAGYITDTLTLFKLFEDNNKWNRNDTRALRRLIPFQNLVLIRKLFDKAEQGINQSLGVKNK